MQLLRNGQAFMVSASGVRSTITGAGSVANLEFDGTAVNSMAYWLLRVINW